MFQADISFTNKEKATQFGEDAKAFMSSFKDCVLFTKYELNALT